jgi:hypothetical protein
MVFLIASVSSIPSFGLAPKSITFNIPVALMSVDEKEEINGGRLGKGLEAYETRVSISVSAVKVGDASAPYAGVDENDGITNDSMTEI